MRIEKEQIIRLVHSARDIILDERKSGQVSEKSAANYVTAADQGVQDYLERELARLAPEVGLFAEEKENDAPDPARSYWILDPVDGTTNLVHHYQFSAISLALWEGGEVTFGIVYNPFMEETYVAQLGKGAFLNGVRLQASGCRAMKDSLVSFGASPYRKEFAKLLFPVYQRIFEQSADFRRGGSAALELCYVAAGRLDAYFEGDLKPWDYAAGQLIAREAGAVCSTFTGSSLPAFMRADVLACAPGIYTAMQTQLRGLAIAGE